MPPISKIAINDSFKSNIYSLHNVSLSANQVRALGQSLQLVDRDINELCFSNNGMQDGQFADLLLSIKDTKQFNGLDKIICVNKNELGPQTLDVIDKMLGDKEKNSLLTHLCFTNCRLRIGSIEPLL